MRTWIGLLLAILMFMGGCAPGYYYRPAYRDPGATMNWYQNPESEGEYQMRLWSEEAGSH